MSRRLTLDDILDVREYERRRDEMRAAVIALKKIRRVALGELLTVVFENEETVRFQIQELVRAERLISDEQVQREIDDYNGLIPLKGELSATVFIELTSSEALRKWLPELVGVERALSIRFRTAAGDDRLVAGAPETAHEGLLTREEATAAVHYVKLRFSHDDIVDFATGDAVLAVDHRAYRAEAAIGGVTKEALLQDLRG